MASPPDPEPADDLLEHKCLVALNPETVSDLICRMHTPEAVQILRQVVTASTPDAQNFTGTSVTGVQNQWACDEDGDLSWSYSRDCAEKWSTHDLLLYLYQQTFSLPPRVTSSTPLFQVRLPTDGLEEGEAVKLPRWYRLPLMLLQKYLWRMVHSQLPICLSSTSAQPQQLSSVPYRAKFLHITRLIQYLLIRAKLKEYRGGMERGWRCIAFDRFLCRVVKDVFDDDLKGLSPPKNSDWYQYDRDLFKLDWRRWALRDHEGLTVTEGEIRAGLTFRQYRSTLCYIPQTQDWTFRGQSMTKEISQIRVQKLIELETTLQMKVESLEEVRAISSSLNDPQEGSSSERKAPERSSKRLQMKAEAGGTTSLSEAATRKPSQAPGGSGRSQPIPVKITSTTSPVTSGSTMSRTLAAISKNPQYQSLSPNRPQSISDSASARHRAGTKDTGPRVTFTMQTGNVPIAQSPGSSQLNQLSEKTKRGMAAALLAACNSFVARSKATESDGTNGAEVSPTGLSTNPILIGLTSTDTPPSVPNIPISQTSNPNISTSHASATLPIAPSSSSNPLKEKSKHISSARLPPGQTRSSVGASIIASQLPPGVPRAPIPQVEITRNSRVSVTIERSDSTSLDSAGNKQDICASFRAEASTINLSEDSAEDVISDLPEPITLDEAISTPQGENPIDETPQTDGSQALEMAEMDVGVDKDTQKPSEPVVKTKKTPQTQSSLQGEGSNSGNAILVEEDSQSPKENTPPRSRSSSVEFLGFSGVAAPASAPSTDANSSSQRDAQRKSDTLGKRKLDESEGDDASDLEEPKDAPQQLPATKKRKTTFGSEDSQGSITQKALELIIQLVDKKSGLLKQGEASGLTDDECTTSSGYRLVHPGVVVQSKDVTRHPSVDINSLKRQLKYLGERVDHVEKKLEEQKSESVTTQEVVMADPTTSSATPPQNADPPINPLNGDGQEPPKNKPSGIELNNPEIHATLAVVVDNLVSNKLLSMSQTLELLKSQSCESDGSSTVRMGTPSTTLEPSSAAATISKENTLDPTALDNLLNEIKSLREEDSAREQRYKEELQIMKQLHNAEVDALRRRLAYLESQNSQPFDMYDKSRYHPPFYSSYGPVSTPIHVEEDHRYDRHSAYLHDQYHNRRNLGQFTRESGNSSASASRPYTPPPIHRSNSHRQEVRPVDNKMVPDEESLPIKTQRKQHFINVPKTG